MQLLDLKADEIDELIEHFALVFQDAAPRERFERALYDDSTLELSQVKVVVEDCKIVSAVRVANRPVRIGGTRVEMGGIGGVSTHPDYRRRGHGTALLQAQVAYMEQQGYDISMLFSGLTGFYQGVGWDCFPEHSCTVPVPENFEGPGDSRYTVREYVEAGDLAAAIRCYDEFNAEVTLSMVRHSAYWQDRHSQFLGCRPWLVAEAGGEVCAYVSGSPRRIYEACCRNGHLQAFVPLAAAAMAAAGEQQHDPLTCQSPFGHPLLDRLRMLAPTRTTHTLSEGMMLRVIRLRPLLEKLVPEFKGRLSQAGFAVSQPLTVSLNQVGQSATLRVLGPEIRVCDDEPELALDLSGREFFLLLCGAATIDELAETLALRGLSIPQPYRKLLRILFPRQDSIYYACDHF